MCYEHKAVEVLGRERVPGAKDRGERQREETLPEKEARTTVSHQAEQGKQHIPGRGNKLGKGSYV